MATVVVSPAVWLGGPKVITCPKCAKDNQDHYKFCLGCGAELPRDGGPKPFAPTTPAQGVKAGAAVAAPAPAQPVAPYVPPPPAALNFPPPPAPAQPVAPVAAPVPVPPSAFRPQAPAAPAPPPPVVAAPVPVGGTVICPQCGHVNGPANVFCGSCGFRLGGAKQPAFSHAPAPPQAEAAAAGSVVLTALRADGSEAGTYALPGGTQLLGRDTGSIFAGDSYLSPRHATFKQAGGRLTVKDEGSLNGVYKKLARDTPVDLKPNDVFRIGQEIIRFEPLASQGPAPDGSERLGAPAKGYVGRIALIIGRDTTGNAFPVPEAGIHLGRERGDVLFPEDGYVSGLHCHLAWNGGKASLTDLGSSNGTFIRLKEETEVRSGDVLLMGQQLFRISM